MRLTEVQKQQLVGLLDWYFSTLTPAKATVIPEMPTEYPGIRDSDAPAQYVPGAVGRAPRQHPDASVSKPIPELAGFVPSAVANGAPSGKTDSNQVKRI